MNQGLLSLGKNVFVKKNYSELSPMLENICYLKNVILSLDVRGIYSIPI